MTEIPEKDIAEQIEQEVASRNGLLALVLCLTSQSALRPRAWLPFSAQSRNRAQVPRVLG